MKSLNYKNLIVKCLAIVSLFVFCTAFAGNKSVPIDYLFLQNAQSGILKLTSKQGIYQLTLKNVQSYVTYFSDRPNRITGIMPIEIFIKEWNKNVSNGTAPNVGIEGVKLHSFKNNKLVSLILVLSHPIYNKKLNTITYTAHALNTQSATIKDTVQLSNIALFIDDFGSCPSCCCGTL